MNRTHNRQQKRYHPVQSVNESVYQMNMARLTPTRPEITPPTAESPFHIALSADVQYSDKPLLTNPNRVIQKYENNNPNRNNEIALYHTRHGQLNAEDKAGKYLENKLYERARSKVLQSGSAEVTLGYRDGNPAESFNTQFTAPGYDSSIGDKTPRYVDQRMINFTVERPYTHESDRITKAAELQRSPEIIERNRRQAEAEKALYHKAKNPTRTEPRIAYHTRSYDPIYRVDNHMEDVRSKFSEQEQVESFVNTRQKFDETTRKILSDELHHEYDGQYKRQLKEMALRESREKFEERKVNNVFETAINAIVNPVKEFIRAVLPNTNIRKENDFKRVDNESSITFTKPGLNKRVAANDHVLLKTGIVPAYYPDDNQVAPVAIMMSNPGSITRTAVTNNKEYVTVIQKRASNEIFDGDNLPFGSDYVTVDIPVEMLSQKLKTKLKDTLRSKVIELSYEDFQQVNSFVLHHPELQKRSTPQDPVIKRAITDLDDTRIFVDSTVLSNPQLAEDPINRIKTTPSSFRQETSANNFGRADSISNYVPVSVTDDSASIAERKRESFGMARANNIDNTPKVAAYNLSKAAQTNTAALRNNSIIRTADRNDFSFKRFSDW